MSYFYFLKNNWTPLVICCKNGNVSTALYLLSLDDINVNHVDKVSIMFKCSILLI